MPASPEWRKSPDANSIAADAIMKLYKLPLDTINLRDKWFISPWTMIYSRVIYNQNIWKDLFSGKGIDFYFVYYKHELREGSTERT